MPVCLFLPLLLLAPDLVPNPILVARAVKTVAFVVFVVVAVVADVLSPREKIAPVHHPPRGHPGLGWCPKQQGRKG